eukprot:Gregarina_sp_Poly_1__1173@NODE_1289_length_4488_cov_179_632888_g456_i1_p2_GENE_NODE_1289_length_4488_cov_179_632888_g456_i1NODE_1289_length_4488_cov_179_632888_g456_i1_p2_ORF_typecomplete_len321_score46_65_NODE_1289_length_4488_cov_179_632888_g456_i132454207
MLKVQERDFGLSISSAMSESQSNVIEEDEDSCLGEDDADVEGMFLALKESGSQKASSADGDAEETGESTRLDELLDSLPDLVQAKTLEQTVVKAVTSTPSRTIMIDRNLPEAQTSKAKNWRSTSDSILLQWITHLCHIAKKGLGSPDTEFQRSFCALHQLYLICAQIPVQHLVAENKSIQRNESDKKESCRDSNLSEEPQNRWRQLYKIMAIAFRCGSIKIPRLIDIEGFSSIFVPDYNSSDPEMRRIFGQLATVDTQGKLSALKRAGEEVLKVIQLRLGREVETAHIHDEVLYSVRQMVVKSRSSRSTSKAIKKAAMQK